MARYPTSTIVLILLYIIPYISSIGFFSRNGPTITSISQLPFDKNQHLASHWLLFTGKACDKYKISETWNRVSTAPNLVNVSSVSTEVANYFFEKIDKGKCVAFSLERGAPISHIKHVLPENVFAGDGSNLKLFEDWLEARCVELEIGFISYHDNPLNILWIDPSNNDRIKIAELLAGETNTYWTYTRIGHQFEMEDTKTFEIIATFTAEYNSFHPIGQPPSQLQKLPNEIEQIHEMFSDEVIRSKDINRTFSSFGFKKGRLPDDVWNSIQTYYYNNQNNHVPEEYSDVSINWYEVPPLFIGMPWGLKGYWQTRLKKLVEIWIGGDIPLENTDIYGIRRYQSGARLLTHVDRTSTHAVSLIINIAQWDVQSPWMVEIYDHAYRLHEIEMEPGDIVYYESAKCLHGRMTPLNGGNYVNLFTHYRPEGDPDWFRKPNPPGSPEPVIDIPEGMEVPTLSPKGHVIHSNVELFEYWKSVSPPGKSFVDEVQQASDETVEEGAEAEADEEGEGDMVEGEEGDEGDENEPEQQESEYESEEGEGGFENSSDNTESDEEL